MRTETCCATRQTFPFRRMTDVSFSSLDSEPLHGISLRSIFPGSPNLTLLTPRMPFFKHLFLHCHMEIPIGGFQVTNSFDLFFTLYFPSLVWLSRSPGSILYFISWLPPSCPKFFPAPFAPSFRLKPCCFPSFQLIHCVLDFF